MNSSKVVIAAVLGLSVGFGISYVFAEGAKKGARSTMVRGVTGPMLESRRDPQVVATLKAEEQSTEAPKFDREAFLKQAQADRASRGPEYQIIPGNPIHKAAADFYRAKYPGFGVTEYPFHASLIPYLKENPAIDYPSFAKQVEEIGPYREKRRVSEEDFIAISKDPATVIFDGRSEKMFNLLHVKGAINLSIPDITAEELAKVIPTKETRVLIYCNNNFTDEYFAFPPKSSPASLNVYTFNTLYTYGYKNIYELGPLLNRKTTKIEFEGSLAQPSATN